MRLAYLDEAGVSDHEPYLVASGILVSPDEDWDALDEFLQTLAKRHRGSEPLPYFHAQDIWHGVKHWDRKKWPLEKRLAVLRDLVAIPSRFRLPVVYGYLNRGAFRRKMEPVFRARKPPPKTWEITAVEHAEAFLNAARGVEGWMRKNAPKEVTMLIAEDTRNAKRALKLMHHLYKPPFELYVGPDSTFQSKKIKDTVHFAEKRESPLLQIADVCAFFIRRRLLKKSDSDAFYEALRPSIVSSAGKASLPLPVQTPRRKLQRSRLPRSPEHLR